MAENRDSHPIEEATSPESLEEVSFGDMLESAFPKLKEFVRFHSGRVLRARECDTDIAQSVCREAIADRSQFHYGGHQGMIRWLFTRARRKIQDKVRYHTADKRNLDRETPIQLGRESSTAPGVILADSATPDRRAIESEMEQQLEAALRRLPKDYRDVVVLSRFENLSHAEIAERIGRTEVATRKILHRALVQLARKV